MEPSIKLNKGNAALFLDIILEKVFLHYKSKSDSKELLNFRLVCRKWNEVASLQIQKLFKLVLKPTYKSAGEYHRKYGDPSSLEMTLEEMKNYEEYRLNVIRELNPDVGKLEQYLSFLESGSSCKVLKFSKYSFKELPMAHPSVTKFFLEHGALIREMELDLNVKGFTNYTEQGVVGIPSADEESDKMDILNAQTFRNILKQATNLEHLNLSSLPRNVTSKGFLYSHEHHFSTAIKKITISSEIVTPSTDFMVDLIRCAPQLEGFYQHDYYPSSELFLHELQHGACRNTLKQLKLCRIPINDLLNIIRAQWQLNRLEIDRFDANDRTEELLKDFLIKQSSSLEYFILRAEKDWLDVEIYKMSFPELPRLRYLSLDFISGMGICSRTWRPMPINFAKQFPNLETLIINGWAKGLDLLNTCFSEINTKPQSMLRNLQLPMGLTPDEMASAGRVFPNVKFLTVPFQCDETLIRIWDNFGNLESLTLHVNRPFGFQPMKDELCLGLDAVLTGLNRKQCKMLRILNEPSNYSAAIGKSSIVNLKKLRTLRILLPQTKNDEIPRQEGDKISNGSIWALGQLNELNHLEIMGHKIDKEGEAILKECIREVQLD